MQLRKRCGAAFLAAMLCAAPVAPAGAAIDSGTAGTRPSKSADTASSKAADASELVALAVGALNRRDIAGARGYFEQALAADPANPDANFGGALTRGIMLSQNPQVKDIIRKWGAVAPPVSRLFSSASPLGNPFGNMSSAGTASAAFSAKPAAGKAPAATLKALLTDAVSTLRGKLPQPATPATPPSATPSPPVAELQSVIGAMLIPEIKILLSRLQQVENRGYTFTVTGEMQGDPYGEDITLDDGDFHTLDAVLNGVLALLEIATAYNFDLYDYDGDGTRNDYDAIARDPLKTLNSPGFFTLKSDGKRRMTDALAFLKTAAGKARSAYAVVKLRAPDEGAFDISGWSEARRNDFERALGTIQTALNGPATVAAGGRQVAMDVTRFFTNPLTKSDLPPLRYDLPPNPALSVKYNAPVAAESETIDRFGHPTAKPVRCEIEPAGSLPDYTLNGIFPGNAPAGDIAGFMALLPVVDGKVLKDASGKVVTDDPRNFITDGTSIYYTVYDDDNFLLRKIVPATGAVSDFATLDPGWWTEGALIVVGSDFYSFTSDWWSGTTALYRWVKNIGGTWHLEGSPVWSFPTDGGWISAATAAGPRIYFALNSWDERTKSYATDLWSLDDFSAGTRLFPVQDQLVNALGYWHNDLFLSGRGTSRVNMAGTTLAAYPRSFSVMIGGYLYTIHDSKLIKRSLP